jgi:hypothetical protein
MPKPEPISELPEPIIDDENPEWTEADFARALPPEYLPPEVLTLFPNTVARLRVKGLIP